MKRRNLCQSEKENLYPVEFNLALLQYI